MPADACPRCNHKKFWRIRRQRRRCARCLYEWRPGPPLRLNWDQWERLLSAYMRGGTRAQIARRSQLHVQRIARALGLVRRQMSDSLIPLLPLGDGPRSQKNARRSSGKSPAPVIVAALCRKGDVWAQAVSRSQVPSLVAQLRNLMRRGSIVCSDFADRNGTGVIHSQIRHVLRNAVVSSDATLDKPVHGLAGFWAWLEKNSSASKHRADPERYSLELAESVWRYNHRALSVEQRVRRLLRLILQHPIQDRASRENEHATARR